MVLANADGSVVQDMRGTVAVVGVGLRLPGGVCSLEQLWSVLDQGRDLVTQVPPDRFEAVRYLDPSGNRAGRTYTTAGGFLEDVVGFDAEYFGMSPKEASRVDPQHRLVLECAVEALDDAGMAPGGLRGSEAAVYVGVSSHDYSDLQLQRPRTFNAYNMAGSASCNAANRLSYFFDLRCPSVAVDTACSSSLTALHEACEAVRSGRSGVALAGGVNVLLSPLGYVMGAQASMLSPSGRCHPFSELADGFVRSEGAGVFVLKSLNSALADGDRIHGVIAATGANCDGHTAGLSLPSDQAQAQLLERVYAAAGVAPGAVDYVEAHGTGTQAGDPVECAALGHVLGRKRAGGPLPIGSVKSNIGHLEAAAGIAGVCKALLVLGKRMIPKTLHCEPVRDSIDFCGLGLEPVTRARALEASGQAVVGVNSFGFGGANAHAVLLSAPGRQPGTDKGKATAAAGRSGPRPLMVSGRTPQAAAVAAERLAGHLMRCDADGFGDVAFTACRRRTHHRHQLAVLADGPAEAAQRMHALAQGDPAVFAAAGQAARHGRVGFVFSGNGSTWAGMGAALLDGDPAFGAEVTQIDELLRPRLGWSVREELAHPTSLEHWESTEVAQPLLFAVQAGLVEALVSRGVTPAAVAGYSVGEVAAAYCAGVLDREAACQVITERSRLQATTRGAGRMAAVGLSARKAEEHLLAAGFADRLMVTALNSDRDVTVGGDAQALADWGGMLGGEGVFFRDLGLDYVFHSPVMDALREPLQQALTGLRSLPARIPYFSTVTGAAADGVLDGDYWWRNVREPVRLAEALGAMTADDGPDVLVEIGPHPVLSTYVRRVTSGRSHRVDVVPTMTRTSAGPEVPDTTLVQLLAAGAQVDWNAYFTRGEHRVVSLPAYPWQRETHLNGDPGWWSSETAEDGPAEPRHPLLGVRHPTAQPTWQHTLDPARLSWLADHKVGTAVVMPAAAFVDMALSGGRVLLDDLVEITGLNIETALTRPFDDPNADVVTQTAVSPRDGSFTISSRRRGQDSWSDHARGRLRSLLRARPAPLDLEAIGACLTGPVDVADHYALCARMGLPYGPAFQTLNALHTGANQSLARFSLTVPADDGHQVHPTVLDGALQAGVALVADTTTDPVPYLPAGVDTVRCWHPVPETGMIHVRSLNAGGAEVRWDITVTDSIGTVMMELLGVRLRRFEGGRPAASAAPGGSAPGRTAHGTPCCGHAVARPRHGPCRSPGRHR
ncbi:type I polyketide synthase [Streptomyces syringium]|uniref:type I polyketide synthase n=1 Tax=Streptomyces syringium TaxID=76729 RepID=UPI003455A6F1